MTILSLDADLSQRLTRIADFRGTRVNALAHEALIAYVNTAEPQLPKEHEFTKLLSSSEFHQRRTQSEQMALIWSYAYTLKPKEFLEKASRLRGIKRRYGAPTGTEIECTGRSTNPKRVPGAEFWMWSNADLRLKRKITARLLNGMQFSRIVIKDAVNAIGAP